MLITNQTTYTIIAFCWHTRHGYGADTEIKAGETVDVFGPYLGKMGEGNAYVIVEGEINCHETEDDDKGFRVSRGQHLALKSGDRGVTVRHYLDKRDV